jgi:hypothetical protein
LPDSTLIFNDEAHDRFIAEHSRSNEAQLLLNASGYPGINLRFAVEQIAARRLIRDKLSEWAEHPKLVFPSKKAAEQASSELTARWKQQLVQPSGHVCDLTGGLGVDSYFLAQRARSLTYVDSNPDCCRAAEHNFRRLGVSNINIIEGEAEQILPQLPPTDAFYIDPDRRPNGPRRVYALNDCRPNLPRLLPRLLDIAPKVIAKLSPMLDIDRTVAELPGVTAVYVAAVGNECRELVVVAEREPGKADIPVTCMMLAPGKLETFEFGRQEEKNLTVEYATSVRRYLYEPNAAILKAGAFKSVTRLGVGKLHPGSHCYTSDRRVRNFPGRTFEVDNIIPFSSSMLRAVAKQIPRANITVRNFPLAVDELRKRTGILDGGSVFLFATTLYNKQKVFIQLRPAD